MINNEKSLVDGCRRNNRKMQEQLYRKYAAEMFSLCLAYERDRELAKEILQKSFIKVFQNIHDFKGKGSLKSWIRKITVHTAIDYIRKKKRINEHPLEENEHFPDRELNEKDNYLYNEIINEVEKLPARAKMVFNLYALEGYKHKEIAEKLDITEGTSKSQLKRAREILLKKMNQILQ